MATYKKKEQCYKHEHAAELKTLLELFGNVLHLEVIESVAKNQHWNLRKTCGILAEMTNNVAIPAGKGASKKRPEKQESGDVKRGSHRRSKSASRSKPRREHDYERIVRKARDGRRLMLLLRGVPGSGKSRLARRFLSATVPESARAELVFTTDDFFTKGGGGVYRFVPAMLQEAHVWNQRRVWQAAQAGRSPIVVDNTNTQAWEMRAYAAAAVQFGYELELLEPDTPWHNNAAELARRNVHGVSKQKITDMLQRYERGLSTERILAMFGLSYEASSRPPQARLWPPHVRKNRRRSQRPVEGSTDIPIVDKPDSDDWDSDADGTWEEVTNPADLLTPDNGEFVLVSPEHRQTPPPAAQPSDLMQFPDQSPPKEHDLIQLSELEAGLQALDLTSSPPPAKDGFIFPDLSALSLQQPWHTLLKLNPPVPEACVSYSSELLSQMKSRETGTNTTGSDFLSKNEKDVKVLLGRPREIGSTYPFLAPRPPPRVLMLHKGTMTLAESVLETTGDCVQQEQHLITLHGLFPQVRKDALQDILEKCRGDVNWAVDLLLEGSGEISTNNEPPPLPSVEESPPTGRCDGQQGHAEGCSCLSDYGLEPFVVSEVRDGVSEPVSAQQAAVIAPRFTKAKSRLDDPLKKELEEKFKVGDEHYSKHVLDIRRKRHGEKSTQPELEPETELQQEMEELTDSDSDLEEDDTVELNLGMSLVEQLERLYGGEHTRRLRDYQPVLQLPASMARQLHALWLQSAAAQADTQAGLLEQLERQDRELAAQLQAQLEQQDQPPVEPPGLQEIMDMELALVSYRADCRQWRRESPDDLAARMTRRKLHEAFPDIQPDVLDEILQAHEGSFERTAEALLCSTGKNQAPGIASVDGRVVSCIEPLDVARRLEQEPPPEDTECEESGEQLTAEQYRELAAHHLDQRCSSLKSAQDAVRRGWPQVAGYYSEMARRHMQRYEMANARAACAFLSEHRLDHGDACTLDLHYLYVREAEQALAMFLDGQISRLRTDGSRRVELFIITGRGRHSQGGRSQIKPAVKRRLRQRKLPFSEVNPGLLRVVVSRHSVLTNDIASG